MARSITLYAGHHVCVVGVGGAAASLTFTSRASPIFWSSLAHRQLTPWLLLALVIGAHAQFCPAVSTQTDPTTLDAAVAAEPLSLLPKDFPPLRDGARPRTNTCLPHEQLTDNPPKALWDSLIDRVFTRFAEHSDKGRSHVSLPVSQALHMRGSVPATRFLVGREWAHVHGAHDGSMHCLV